MQIIKLTETTAAQIEVPFTSVLASNLQSRILGSTLANTSISVYAKRGGTGAAVALTSDGTTWTATDDTNAPGVRGYKPKTAELVAGFQTLVFTGTNMEPREVPLMVVTADPFDPATGAAQTSLASAVSTASGYVDTEVAAIKAKTDNLPSDPADASDIAAATSSISSAIAALPSAATIATAVWAVTIETGFSALQSFRGLLSLVGKHTDSSLEDGSGVFYAPDGVTARVTYAIVNGIKTITRNW
jgi:hypothetical protein